MPSAIATNSTTVTAANPAFSLSLYLVVRLIWVTAALLGHGPDDYGTADWCC
ncbi:hypothetical protein [Nonomuraea sp. LPB2021202275-12-8]|uniref:hypothetical protein n=1 Tax=Nonomuraea sp. LPB2021202275-12-8 TaxID=3120159 RepID=UPI00300C7F82